MKQFIFLILLLQNFSLQAQNTAPHSYEAPPLNPYGNFTRSLQVDCADLIVYDIANSNALGCAQQLHDFISNNFISSVILRDLNNVFGNSMLENALRFLNTNLHHAFPGLTIGVCGSTSSFFNQTDFLKASDFFRKECQPKLFSGINSGGNASRQREELHKFFVRATSYNNKEESTDSYCAASFDILYLEDRYWDESVYTSLNAMQNAFNDFKNTLEILKSLKCSYTCIKEICAEFQPTQKYMLQAWTAIDQITEADPLMDKIVLPSFTPSSQFDQSFDQQCRNYHYIADRFSKNGSKIIAGFSAESSGFYYCNTASTPPDFLGEYLNGTALSQGNMYSVEKKFLNQVNDPAFQCSWCSCNIFPDNHQQTSYMQGNNISGSMWYYYTMMKTHNLSRSLSHELTEQTTQEIKEILVFDAYGQPLEQNQIKMHDLFLSSGIYYIKTIFNDGTTMIKKIFSLKY
jgi:hypothetical protein